MQTKQEKSEQLIEIFSWMTKKGYDRKASKEISPIIQHYINSEMKVINNDIKPHVIGQSELLMCTVCNKNKKLENRLKCKSCYKITFLSH